MSKQEAPQPIILSNPVLLTQDQNNVSVPELPPEELEAMFEAFLVCFIFQFSFCFCFILFFL